MNAEQYTQHGIVKRGAFENLRNEHSSDLFKDLIRRCFGQGDVIVAHHIAYIEKYHHGGFDYQMVQEIASADTLIFDHEAAKTLWGDHWKTVLQRLAITPVPERDKLLARFYQAKQFEGDKFDPDSIQL